MASEQLDGFKIEEVFESAVTIVKNLPKEGPVQPSNDLKLKLYAYYKQATCGPNDTSRPYIWQAVEYYKWNAWLKLGDMSKEEAMRRYIMELKKIMETIPKEKTDPNASKHFEEVLGKKFYDYWFNQWEQKLCGREITTSQQSGRSMLPSSSSSSTSHMVHQRSQEPTGTGNDTHSNSSGGSSMSMLEETQTPEGDGYKTPNSIEQCNIAGSQMTDQFALALLRLQHGLDQTVGRLDRLEELVRQSLEGLSQLQNQTNPKQRISATSGGGSGGKRAATNDNCRRKLTNFVHNFGIIHWFYLSYPFVVYMILRALERRRRSHRPLW